MYKNTFAPMVRRDELTAPQIIQLLKIQVIEFDDLPENVGEAVEAYFDDKKKLEAMADDVDMLDNKTRLQAIQLQADKKDEKGRWITTKKGLKVFIPEGHNVKGEIKKAIERLKNSDKKKPEPYWTEKRKERQKSVKKMRLELAKRTFNLEFDHLIEETEAERKRKGIKSINMEDYTELLFELKKKHFNSDINKNDKLEVRKLFRKGYREFIHKKEELSRFIASEEDEKGI